MNRLRGWLCFLMVLMAANAVAQQVPEWLREANVPPPPAEMVSDESGLYDDDPEALERMRQAVRKLADERGFRIYVVIRPVMIASDSMQLAGQLQQAWVPDGDGIVLVYESNSKSLGLGRGYEEVQGDSDGRWRMPSHEFMRIFTNAMKMEGKPAPAEFLERLTLRLAESCSEYFVKKEAPVPAGRMPRFAALALGSLVLLGVIGGGLALVLRRFGHGATGRFVFPKSDLPQRLKAPFGGGMVIVRRFGAEE
ncbi:MAG: hypothetical protein QM627_02315 [Luteolibacter sp.]